MTSSLISSNTVIWEGENIPCISLCTGDTISVVFKKLADEICELVDNINNISNLNISSATLTIDEDCLNLNAQNTVQSVINAIIEKLCVLEDNIPAPNQTYIYPGCSNTSQTSYQLQAYLTELANKICTLNTITSTINTQITSLQAAINNLQTAVNTPTSLPTITIASTCLLNNQNVALNSFLSSFETAFCELRNLVGTTSQINSAINSCLTGISPLLNQSGTFSTVSGWQSNPTSLAQSVNNLWLVVCNLHSAVSHILETCCCDVSGNCDQINYAFQVSETNGSLQVTFSGLIVPAPFNAATGWNIQFSQGSLISTKYVTSTPPISNNNNISTVWTIPAAWTGSQINVTVNFAFQSSAPTVVECAQSISQVFQRPHNGHTIGTGQTAQTINCDSVTATPAAGIDSNGNNMGTITVSIPDQSMASSVTIIVKESSTTRYNQNFNFSSSGTSIVQTISLPPGTYSVEIHYDQHLTNHVTCTKSVTVPYCCSQYTIINQTGGSASWTYTNCLGNSATASPSNNNSMTVCSRTYPTGPTLVYRSSFTCSCTSS